MSARGSELEQCKSEDRNSPEKIIAHRRGSTWRPTNEEYLTLPPYQSVNGTLMVNARFAPLQVLESNEDVESALSEVAMFSGRISATLARHNNAQPRQRDFRNFGGGSRRNSGVDDIVRLTKMVVT